MRKRTFFRGLKHESTKPNLLLDVDGVLRDLMGKCVEVYRRDYDSSSKIGVSDIKQWDFAPHFPALKNPYFTFFEDALHRDEIFAEAEPLEPDRLRSTLRRVSDYLNIYIMSNQFEWNVPPTMEWLKKHDVPCIDAIFQKDKVMPFKNNGFVVRARYAIDDAPHYLLAYAQAQIYPVCYNQSWNSGWKGPKARNLEGCLSLIPK